MPAAIGPGRVRRRGVAAGWPVTAGVLVSGSVLVLVVGLLWAGGAPPPAAPGLPGPGHLTAWLLPLSRLGGDLAAVVAVGGLLTAWALLPPDGPRLSTPALRLTRDASVSLLVWAGAALAGAAATAAVELGVPLVSVPVRLEAAAGLSQVQTLALSAVVAVLTAVATTWARTRAGAGWCLAGVVAALLPPLLTGHLAAGEHPWIGVPSLLVHVVAATAWMGGLVALFRLRRVRGPLVAALPRFSALALVCACLVGITGTLAAAVHLAGPGDNLGHQIQTALAALVSTGYGALVLAKTGAYGVLVACGWWHRHRTLPLAATGRTRDFLRWAAVELVVMGATFGVAVALSRTP